MGFQQRYNQFKNLISPEKSADRPLKWVFIYGHHRGGTTYMMRQFEKVSKRSTGDWMMDEFAIAFQRAETRERQTLDVRRLYSDFRKNLLENAPVGAGAEYDIVIKQATGEKRELEFLKKLFCSEPAQILFLFREPHGWWRSAVKKFPTHNDSDREKNYRSVFESYENIGGQIIEYGPSIHEYLKSMPEFGSVEIEDFSPKPPNPIDEAKPLEDVYQAFKTKVGLK